MTEDQEKMLAKAKKLFNQMKGEENVGNEEAAKNMAAILNKLLIKHRLSLQQVEDKELDQKDEEIVNLHVSWFKHDMKTKRQRIRWEENLGSIIARANGCYILVRTGSNIISFVGKESAAKICEYIFVTLVRTARKISVFEYHKAYKKAYKVGAEYTMQGWKQSFLASFCNRIQERFKEEENLFTKESPHALMVIKKDLAEVQKYMSRISGGPAPKLKGVNNWNREGALAGRDKADSMNIGGKAIEKNGNHSPKELGS
jgi:hypothetical protein